MVEGKGDIDGILFQKDGAQRWVGVDIEGKGDKGAVHISLDKLEFGGAVLQLAGNIKLNVWVEGEKGLDDLGQPVGGDAVEGGDADASTGQPKQPG